MSVRDGVARLREEIDAELVAAGRRAGAVAILGASKGQSVEAIGEAVRAGVCDIGENYVKEAAEKLPLLRQESADAGCFRAHFIGHVQTNKAKKIVELFDVVQTVDRPEAARALANAAETVGKRLAVLLQINISATDRLGCPPGDAAWLAEVVEGNPWLRLDGVMAIGPNVDDRGEIIQSFALAAKTFALVGGSTLSIGMSGDWREAVRAGSTMIRIGTALFGERRYG